MRFPTEVFFAAFAQVGMVVPAIYRPGTAYEGTFYVQWNRPDQLLLADEAQGAEFQIEYAACNAPDLKRGDRLQIEGEHYTVRQRPMVQGDGSFVRAYLNRFESEASIA